MPEAVVPRTPSRHRRRIRALFLGLLLALVAMEAVLQIAHALAGHETPIAPSPERGEPFRILCLGDSFTYGLGVHDTEGDYPAWLRRRIDALRLPGARPVLVLNAGVPAQNSSILRHRLGDLLEEHRVDTVLVLGGINNAWNLGGMEGIPLGSLPWSLRVERVLQWSRLYQLLSLWIRGVFRPARSDGDGQSVRPVAFERQVAAREARWFYEQPREEIFELEGPLLPMPLHRRVLHEDFEAMAARCEEIGARLVFQTYPTTHPICAVTDDVAREVATAHGLAVVDHAPVFRELRERLWPTAFMVDPLDFHLNAEGNEILARLVLARARDWPEWDFLGEGETARAILDEVVRANAVSFAATLATDGRRLRLHGSGPAGHGVVAVVRMVGPDETTPDRPRLLGKTDGQRLGGRFDADGRLDLSVPLNPVVTGPARLEVFVEHGGERHHAAGIALR